MASGDVVELPLARLLVNATVGAVAISSSGNGSAAGSAVVTAVDADAESDLDRVLESIEPHENRPETYFVPVLFALIFIVGVLGNGTLVLVFARDPKMRNVPNTYIFSLALGDLLVILTSVPFTSTVYTLPSWPFGGVVCKVSETAKDVSIGVSVFTLTALAADRFLAISDPMRRLTGGSSGRWAGRWTVTSAAFIWLLAVLMAVPAAVNSYVRDIPAIQNNVSTSLPVCYPYPANWEGAMTLLRFIVYYAVPLVIIAVLYALMARHLILSTRNMPGEQQGQARQIRARRKVAKTVLAFVVVFAVCFFPHHVFALWFHWCPTAHQDYNAFWHYFRIVGFCLSFLNSCVNPIALYCVSGTFRKKFNRYLLCKNGCGSSCCDHKSCGHTNSLRRNNSCSLTTGTSRRNCARRHWDSTSLLPLQHRVASGGPIGTTKRMNGEECTMTTLMNGSGAISALHNTTI